MDDVTLRALSDADLAAQLELAERGLRFTFGCDTNAMLGDERHFRQLTTRLALEQQRRQGPIVQAPGDLAAKVRGNRAGHATELHYLTGEAVNLAQAQRMAIRRAARARTPRDYRSHRQDARILAEQFRRLVAQRRALRRLIADADASLAVRSAAE